MADVDLVISALFETSGVRLEGDCARLLPELITSKTKPTKKTFIDFTAPILLSCAECEIFGRCTPTFRSFGFAYGSIERLPAFICDKKERQCCKLKNH